MKEPKNGFKNGRKITSREKKYLSYHTLQALNGETGKNSSIPKVCNSFSAMCI